MRDQFVKALEPNIVVRVEVLSGNPAAQKLIYEDVKSVLRRKYRTISDEANSTIYIRTGGGEK